MLTEIAEKIWRISGGLPGPNIVVLGGIHGNELVGIQIVKRLVEEFGRYPTIQRGSATLALGNLKAIEIGKRWYQTDLNRCFDIADDGASEQETYEHGRARELLPFKQSADLLLDIHATNKPSEPFTRVPGQLTERQKAVLRKLEGCHTLLWDPRYLIGQGRRNTSVDSVGRQNEGIGICYETGWAGDTTCFPRVLRAVTSILRDELGWEAPGPEPPLQPAELVHAYELYDVRSLTEKVW